MNSKSSEQFEVLSNALRVLPEEALKLNYYWKEKKKPEEGISKIEIACADVFHQIYGLMYCLKEEGHITSIYTHEAITTILCIRLVLQRQGGRIKNSLRDAYTKQIAAKPVFIKFNASEDDQINFPFLINVNWIQECIENSNNAEKLPLINQFWTLDKIRTEIESSSLNWKTSYLCVMSLITAAVRQICVDFGPHFKLTSDDSKVFFEHFSRLKAIKTDDYAITT